MYRKVTVRLCHYPSRAPITELELGELATVGDLKAAVMKCLGQEESCPLRVVDRWYVEASVGKMKRLFELNSSDEIESITNVGIEDYTTVLLGGPDISSLEGLGLAVGIVQSQLHQTRAEQCAANAHFTALITKLVESQQTIADGQKEISLNLKRLANLQTFKEDRIALNESMVATLEEIRIEEGTAFDVIWQQYQQKYIDADAAFAKFPGMPMKAFWSILMSTKTTGPVVAATMVGTERCALEQLSTKEEEYFTNSVFRTGIGSTPLLLAAHANRYDVVSALVAMGANVNTADTQWKSNVLHSAAVNNSAAVLKLMLAKNVNINSKNTNGETPLHWAAAYARLSAILVLVNNGADITATTNKGHTPLARYEEDGKKRLSKEEHGTKIIELLSPPAAAAVDAPVPAAPAPA